MIDPFPGPLLITNDSNERIVRIFLKVIREIRLFVSFVIKALEKGQKESQWL